MKAGRSAHGPGDRPGTARPDPTRRGPGELTFVAFVVLAVGAYSLAQGAQTSQDGLVVVGVFAAAVLVVGIAWPVVALAGVSVAARAPGDAAVGDVIPVEVTVQARSRRVQVRLLDPPEPWHLTGASGRVVLEHAILRRGVYPYVRVEVRTGGPVGVFLRRRSFLVALGAPVLVAPRAVPTRWDPAALPDSSASRPDPARVRQAGDTVRAVRPYVAGDPARLVHWPTSARTGMLAVRELEPPVRTGLALAVELGADAAGAEEVASRAAGLGRAVLAAGGDLVLATCQAEGPVVAPVSTVRDLGRRLARAVPGVPAPLPPGWPAVRSGP